MSFIDFINGSRPYLYIFLSRVPRHRFELIACSTHKKTSRTEAIRQPQDFDSCDRRLDRYLGKHPSFQVRVACEVESPQITSTCGKTASILPAAVPCAELCFAYAHAAALNLNVHASLGKSASSKIELCACSGDGDGSRTPLRPRAISSRSMVPFLRGSGP